MLAIAAIVTACGTSATPEVKVDTAFSDCAANEQFSAGVVQQAAEGRVGPYALLYENTAYLLFGQDGCVWARAGDLWNQVRARRLSQSEKEALQARLGLETWGTLSGQYQGDAFDGSPYLFFDGRSIGLTIFCAAACTGTSVPPAVAGLAAAYGAERDRFAQSEPLYAGHVRFMLVRQEDGTDRREPPLTWPLTDLAASTVALSPTDPRTNTFGNGVLTRTPRQAALLRLLRNQFLARPDLSNGRLDIPVVERGVRYSLTLRDALPIETAEGRVPLP